MERTSPSARQKTDSRCCESHPRQVERSARADDRDQQGTDELERDRDPERDPVDRAIKRQIHAGKRRSERADQD